jgi:plasmid maintenance system antidote protein VapI
MTRTCTRTGCERPRGPRGYCTACYQTRRKREIAYGRWSTISRVDPTEARTHLHELLAQGTTGRQIAEATGLAQKTITDLNTGRYRTIAAQTAQLILDCRPGIPLERLSPNQKVDATGTIRRLQALMAMGWSGGKISAELGWHNEQLQRVRAGGHSQVTARTAIRVRDLFDRLWDIDGGDKRARGTAIRNGWALPMEWDDIDDPNETPTVARRTDAGQRDRALDRIEQVAAWMDDPRPEWHKGSTVQLAERLDVQPRTIERDKARIRSSRVEEEDAA